MRRFLSTVVTEVKGLGVAVAVATAVRGSERPRPGVEPAVMLFPVAFGEAPAVLSLMFVKNAS